MAVYKSCEHALRHKSNQIKHSFRRYLIKIYDTLILFHNCYGRMCDTLRLKKYAAMLLRLRHDETLHTISSDILPCSTGYHLPKQNPQNFLH